MLCCPACGFLWLREKILHDAYYEELDVGITPAKAQRRHRNVLDRVRKIGRHISLQNVCDLGAGDGLFLQMLRERGYRGGWGIEPSVTGVTYARRLGLDVERGTIEDLPVLRGNRRIDTFTLFHVLEHLDDPRGVLRGLHEQLPSDGHIAIEVPNLHGFAAEAFGEDWEFYYPEHLWYFDDRTLPAFVRGSGFEIVAQGRRDFDLSRKSITELLFRLGIGSYKPPRKKAKAVAPPLSAPAPVRPSIASAARIAAGTVLAALVERLGRMDSVWVIGRKH